MVKLQSLSAVRRPGPGGARLLAGACAWPRCNLLHGPALLYCTDPAPRDQSSPPESLGPAWAALGPRQVGLAGACQGNCTKSKKERHDEYSWVFVNTFLGI